MNVYEKLSKIQTSLKAPKNQFNSFGKYNYRSCEDILEGVKPLLTEVKATLLLNDTVEQIGERIYIKATATLIDNEKGEKVEVNAYAREDETKKGMDLSQVTGSTSSYARKYALNGLFCIDDTKDSDATNDHSSKTPQNKPQAKENTKKANTSKENKTPSNGDLKCEKCGVGITEKIAMWSTSNYNGKKLCMNCQKEEAKNKED